MLAQLPAPGSTVRISTWLRLVRACPMRRQFKRSVELYIAHPGNNSNVDVLRKKVVGSVLEAGTTQTVGSGLKPGITGFVNAIVILGNSMHSSSRRRAIAFKPLRCYKCTSRRSNKRPSIASVAWNQRNHTTGKSYFSINHRGHITLGLPSFIHPKYTRFNLG